MRVSFAWDSWDRPILKFKCNAGIGGIGIMHFMVERSETFEFMVHFVFCVNRTRTNDLKPCWQSSNILFCMGLFWDSSDFYTLGTSGGGGVFPLFLRILRKGKKSPLVPRVIYFSHAQKTCNQAARHAIRSVSSCTCTCTRLRMRAVRACADA